MSEQALLEVRNLVLQYKTWEHLVTATWNVNFDVQRGDRFVLLGPSGCGKSSILKAVGGFLPPVSGSMKLDGKLITQPGPDRLMVFQEFEQLLPWKSVRENVMFPMRVTRRFPAREIGPRADEVIEKVGLGRFVDAFPHTLSGGMKMRVAIARALAMEPAILLMDEPFAALDALTRRKMQEELLSLWEQTAFTMLFVTHSIEEAILVGSRILVLSPHPGRVQGRTRRSSIHAGRYRGAGLCRSAAPHPRHAVPETGGGALIMAKTLTVFTVRPEIDNVVDDVPANLDVQRKLSLPERLLANAAVRRVLLLLCLAVIWELYALHVDNPLLFPRFSETLVALWNALFHGPLLDRMASSLRVLLMGYGIGIALAGVLVTFAVSTAVGQDLLTSLTAMFNPLPAIALLPLAMLWFGLGQGSLVFVIVHSVLWAVALNALSGFTSVNETLRMSGQNYGLRGARFVTLILIPAALPSILSGLKIGWAFAWRTLIAAELVFGATSRSGGLGWFIYENRNQLETPSVFAGLFVVIIIGLLVESVIFRFIESRTVRRWGMQR